MMTGEGELPTVREIYSRKEEQQPEWIRLLTLIFLLVSQSNIQLPGRIGW